MSEKLFKVEIDPFTSSTKQIENISEDQIEVWRQISKEYFNEDPDEVNEKIQELKQKILESEFKLPRQDMLYILKFLRAGGGNVEAGLDVVKNYLSIVKDQPGYFENCLPSKLDKVFAEQINMMTQGRDEYGRRVYIFRPGRWNPR